ncbi:hypothetical protein [Zunongwangia pacifica]|nr:hypothetical protein [Zunongwangia pacifica]
MVVATEIYKNTIGNANLSIPFPYEPDNVELLKMKDLTGFKNL